MPTTVYLKDYAPPNHRVTHVDLTVHLDAARTVVESVFTVESQVAAPLVLNGESLELLGIAIDGVALNAGEYHYTDDLLTLHAPPAQPFQLSLTQACNPLANTTLSGLYVSSGVFCTQMEAEGFRRFAFMQDRPDVMATYKVRVEAPKTLPVLLSNGNLVEAGEVSETHHFAVWQDPHPKPTYLFALVAGDLACLKGSFTTSEGRNVELGIYVEQGKQDRCGWAMDCLKASIKWDEERFGRTYDLDVFNIVAVSDFNMGAMENKGLNIFNDKYILARPDTATDTDYVNIERIIAHEYFHNWSGNRITCRDWFQLCLKEGLTVFRDQEFTSDLRSRAVKRIEDVKTLRARQFPEDQGPLAHAVRPSSYIEISNFYTPTIYEKGAEICRMLHTLLGGEKFRTAMNLYFNRHDGEAATVEDFLACMAETSGRDLTQFSKWYEQAGTPVVAVKTSYSEVAREFTVTLSQHTPSASGKPAKTPLHIPINLALLSADGAEMQLHTTGKMSLVKGVFELDTAKATLTFTDVKNRPVLSINRNFSAPIIVQHDVADADLLFQMANDSDSFNRWDAAQICAKQLLVDAYHGRNFNASEFANGLLQVLQSKDLDDAFKALMLQLPSEAELTVALASNVNADRVHSARQDLLLRISSVMHNHLLEVLETTRSFDVYRPDTASCARRNLRGAALSLLGAANPALAVATAQKDFDCAADMTTEAGSVSALLAVADNRVDNLLERFYQRHKDDHLIVDKWLTMKAARALSAIDIAELQAHKAFTFKTPNRVYALLGGFTGGNLKSFHAADGSGYRLLAKSIITLNAINPQVAARMATAFRVWGRYDTTRKAHAVHAMEQVLNHTDLSNDVFEIISRTLKG